MMVAFQEAQVGGVFVRSRAYLRRGSLTLPGSRAVRSAPHDPKLGGVPQTNAGIVWAGDLRTVKWGGIASRSCASAADGTTRRLHGCALTFEKCAGGSYEGWLCSVDSEQRSQVGQVGIAIAVKVAICIRDTARQAVTAEELRKIRQVYVAVVVEVSHT